MDSLTIRDVDLTGKRVIMRVDYNVPLAPDSSINDDSRIKATIPTIRYLQDRKASIILVSHLGRPKGRDSRFSLIPVKGRLEKLLVQEIIFAEDLFSEETEKISQNLKPGEIMLLENIRYYPGEEENSPILSEAISRLGDIYVNEAFSASHRAHASTYGVPTILPGYAGILLEQEVNYLTLVGDQPKKPMVLLLGGAKVLDKLGIIDKLLPGVDVLIIGGGMCFTFLKALGMNIGKSIQEEDKLEVAREIINRVQKESKKILLPIDVVVSSSLAPDATGEIIEARKMKNGDMGLDIGPQTVKLFTEEILRAATIFWNGPMGVFELEAFWEGTRRILEAFKDSQAVKIAGGGDTLSAIAKGNAHTYFTFLSTGGGASLELLEGKELPGISVLKKK
ncbi:MAG: Bifunctional PGK [candidate division WS2 bacterium]|uniref:Phosphoglycerate kinase n=1 Tax=Psychracetigena formicireducens TaxID=2986056 RepID=A0A9E2BEJ8_PSYF1|nr:Bifunctional PGK [Candidatus Psychracetigena formicireducens]MBT9144170.1 Bifunctional PGK [Candidatus Psychracetigena formicireducens]MBT9150008.1 Bifunctional PGK [Candidatus Psychracetigena formicireducens]